MTPSLAGCPLAGPILLLIVAIILLFGFFVVVNLLVEIRDALTVSCSDLKRVADEIDGDELT